MAASVVRERTARLRYKGLPVPQPPHLPALPPCVGRYGNGVIATPSGAEPTGTVATTVLLAVAMTDTSLEP